MKKLSLLVIIFFIFSGIVLYLSPALRVKLLQLLPAEVNKQIDTLTSMPLTTKPLYQWKDKNGQWIVSDTKPAKNIPYEIKQYNRETNVVPANGNDKNK